MKKKTVAVYARVSTDKQKVDMQLQELSDFIKRSGWKLYKQYIDHGYTGANTKRPDFSNMMIDARQRKFDILIVWKLDRLSRSLKDLINTLDELGHLGIDFISYDNHLDTSTPTGKLVFQIIEAVAEFEKDIIRERVKAGLNNAKSKEEHGVKSCFLYFAFSHLLNSPYHHPHCPPFSTFISND